MIQFNLLPDVKLEYIKAKYKRRIIAVFSFLIGGIFLTIFIMMFLYVRVNQTTHLSNLDTDINNGVEQLRENEDLDKVLTIQNQLNSLPALHEQKVMTSRLFDYLTQLTPNDASISSVSLDTQTKEITIKGSADSVQTVNKYVDTIKFTEFKFAGDEPKEGKAFSSVVLTNFNIENIDGGGKPGNEVTYEIKFVYDETIFKNTAVDNKPLENSVKLTVPKIITTRSETQKPKELFQKIPTPEEVEQGADQ